MLLADDRHLAIVGGHLEVLQQIAAELGDPAWLLPPWLAHATRGGRTVPAGTVVTTGSWSGLGDAAAGDRVELDFADLGALALQF